MVTERYQGAHGVQPGSLLAATAICGGLVAGLMLASPKFTKDVTRTLIGINIPIAQPEPEPVPETHPIVRETVKPSPRAKPVDTFTPIVATDTQRFVTGPGTLDGIGKDPIETILPPLPTPTPAPVLTGPSVDPRYARDLQPNYPAGEQRAGREGLVTVRILVGADGRVKQVERVSAASEAFYAATERQALSKWRFRPATRDGVPVEGWRTMTVRFEMPAD